MTINEAIELTKEDLLISMAQKEGYASQADGGVTVVMDTNLTDELIEEGHVREIISKIQNLRKDTQGLEVTDRIVLNYAGNEKLCAIIAKNKDYIASEVLASSMTEAEVADMQEKEVNGEKIRLSLKKA